MGQPNVSRLYKERAQIGGSGQLGGTRQRDYATTEVISRKTGPEPMSCVLNPDGNGPRIELFIRGKGQLIWPALCLEELLLGILPRLQRHFLRSLAADPRPRLHLSTGQNPKQLTRLKEGRTALREGQGSDDEDTGSQPHDDLPLLLGSLKRYRHFKYSEKGVTLGVSLAEMMGERMPARQLRVLPIPITVPENGGAMSR